MPTEKRHSDLVNIGVDDAGRLVLYPTEKSRDNFADLSLYIKTDLNNGMAIKIISSEMCSVENGLKEKSQYSGDMYYTDIYKNKIVVGNLFEDEPIFALSFDEMMDIIIDLKNVSVKQRP
ncbi:hypothetical protein [Azospirillum agricola]|uniref:hypothetical protein n=1 Tax=Azospirillum agricola TaxID=1720247 RepID=UPI000A0F28D9|nr:hypothetical protein [Azospirillum agricola]SMH47894.1 hypothetical protein SAMN02982994_2674 [Azospirillum lipoferum]